MGQNTMKRDGKDAYGSGFDTDKGQRKEGLHIKILSLGQQLTMRQTRQGFRQLVKASLASISGKTIVGPSQDLRYHSDWIGRDTKSLSGLMHHNRRLPRVLSTFHSCSSMECRGEWSAVEKKMF
jgi:hypothetical protein